MDAIKREAENWSRKNRHGEEVREEHDKLNQGQAHENQEEEKGRRPCNLFGQPIKFDMDKEVEVGMARNIGEKVATNINIEYRMAPLGKRKGQSSFMEKGKEVMETCPLEKDFSFSQENMA